MKFMMLVCVDPDRFTEDEAAAADTAENGNADNMGSFPWLDDVIARGIRLHGDRLRPAEEAKTVLVRDGEVLVSDGPFGRQVRQDRGQGGVAVTASCTARRSA